MHKRVNNFAVRGARVALGLACVTALAGCGIVGRGDKGPKTPVLGNRVSILSPNAGAEADTALAGIPVDIPASYVNTEWAQPGGNSSKSMGHVALSATPRQIWSASISGSSPKARLGASPVIKGGKLFVIGTDGTVSAFDAASGARLWSTGVGGRKSSATTFGGGVSVGDDRVFVTTGAGEVAALSSANGSVAWKKNLTTPLRGAPTLFGGQLYVMTQDNQILALNQTDGETQWSESGTVQSTGVFGVAAPAAAQGTVIAGFSSGELSAYRYENGRSLWGDALSRTSISTAVASLADIDADPVVDRGRVFAIGQGGRMASYELVSGQRLWEVNVGGISTPTVAGEWVFVVTNDAKLLCISRTTGRIRYMRQLPRWKDEKHRKNAVRWTGPLLAGGHLILVSTDGDLAYADPANGAPTAIVDVGHSMSLRPVVANNILYILADDGHVLALR